MPSVSDKSHTAPCCTFTIPDLVSVDNVFLQEDSQQLHIYCIWSWMKWSSVKSPPIYDHLLYLSQAFPAPGQWHSSLTQWAELYITLEQQGIKLPQQNKKVDFE